MSPAADIEPNTLAQNTPLDQSPTAAMRRASPLPFAANANGNGHYPHQAPPPFNPSAAPSASSAAPTKSSQTGKVIERLTSENDRLRRDMKALQAKFDEAAQQNKVHDTVISQLREKNDNLSFENETHAGVLKRKETRMDELKRKLDEQELRTRQAEERAQEMARRLEEERSQMKEDMARAKSAQHAAETAYKALSHEYWGHDRQIKKIQSESRQTCEEILNQATTNNRLVLKLEVIQEQQRQHLERADHVNKGLSTTVHLMQNIEQETLVQYNRVESVLKELEATRDKMRWVMQLQKVRDEREALQAPNNPPDADNVPMEPMDKHQSDLPKGQEPEEDMEKDKARDKKRRTKRFSRAGPAS